MVNVELTEDVYQVEESDSVRVCAKLAGENRNCIVPFVFIVILSTIDGSGNYKTCTLYSHLFFCYFLATSTDDYSALGPDEARFPPCTSEVCVTITTVNDELVEGNENFSVSLTRGPQWDSRISISRSKSEVVIIDDDRKWRATIYYTPLYYFFVHVASIHQTPLLT